jgi:low molecular weight phosphotyrosine protein phosphatase
MAPKDSTATIALFGSFGDNKPIADPYYGGIVSDNPPPPHPRLQSQGLINKPHSQNGFEKAYDQCVRYSNGFLDQVFGQKESVL